ncbi:21.7 kDa class VI heat shock protein [Coffea eugenioides]|uniref:21.7 kDa class VI heat shock protein-like n=1 Tax=Coffea arabica TaxID=13443 RepID=A0ABM4UDK4_COFAR|nr:21.7 kDa class VI heat shock protein [Coffea eugenioides]
MTSYKKIEVLLEDHSSQKWCLPLKEDVFTTFLEKGNPVAHKIFGEGSLFSPLLFGKFFDPSDAFPLWEFDADVLLSNLYGSSEKRTVDWFQTDADYVLKAELPESGKNSIQVCVEKGEVVEISGQWRQQQESRTKDWRGSNWWEHGYVRRIELPDDADWRNMEACVTDDRLLEIRVPKSPVNCIPP